MRCNSKMGPTRGEMAEKLLKTNDLSIPNDLESFPENLFLTVFLPPFWSPPPRPPPPRLAPPRIPPPPASPRRASPPPPPSYCNVNPKIAHLQAFWELAWAKMGQKWVKIALNHLFEHPKWCRNNFGKIILDHFWIHK